MKVILNQAVPKLGKEGQVVTVADGYARNFLFPRGLAIVAEKNQVKALEVRKARMAAKLAEKKADAEALRERLHGQTLRIAGKVGTDGIRLFGAITNADVTEALNQNFKITLERKSVALVQPIKRLGDYDVRVDLHPDVDAHVTVTVFDPSKIEVPVAEADETEIEEA